MGDLYWPVYSKLEWRFSSDLVDTVSNPTHFFSDAYMRSQSGPSELMEYITATIIYKYIHIYNFLWHYMVLENIWNNNSVIAIF